MNMHKLITILVLAIALGIGGTSPVHGEEFVVSASASIQKEAVNTHFDFRVTNLEYFLAKYNSPLTTYAAEFVTYADKYGIDYRLVPAIAGVESTFGKRIPFKSFNAYGWANGKYKFTSWEDSINIVTMALRTKYIDRGAPTIAKIGRRYAPPSKTWAGKVTFFINKIDTLPVTFDI